MNPECASDLAAAFTSRSQQARIVTEDWFGRNSYCIACQSGRLEGSAANAKARDFECPQCQQSYELKSGQRLDSKRVPDGAYATMLERIRARDAPTLVLLQYDRSEATTAWLVKKLVAIHPVFLTDAVVEPRPPLSASARRAGWQGCTIRIDRIPPEGRIVLLNEGKVTDASQARALYESSQRLAVIDPVSRGWTTLVLRIVRQIGNTRFTLAEVYARRQLIEQAYPNNRHVEAKVRQQLQVLRDLGYLRFTGRGVYDVIG